LYEKSISLERALTSFAFGTISKKYLHGVVYFIHVSSSLERIRVISSNGCAIDQDIDTNEDSVCGDGIVNGNEQCDDGNTTNGDGCENDCTNTPDPVCGDGSQLIIKKADYFLSVEKLKVNGEATVGTLISIINSDTGDILRENIRVNDYSTWKAEIQNVGSNLENISVISSTGCTIDQEI
jgi:cysteine-rich repeat protein